MLTLLSILASLGASPLPADLPAIGEAGTGDAPLRLWMNNDRRYRPGDKVRLQVDADGDGYLLVLHFDTDGRLKVLFPLDPRDDALVQSGRRYEVRDFNGEGAFQASGDGTGLIYTAISQDPWRFDQVILADRWDYTRIEIDRDSKNPEQDITDMLQGIAGPRGFDYDVLGYRVYGESSYGYTTVAYPTARVFLYDSYYCNNWYWRYDNCPRWRDGGWAFGWGYDPYYRYGYGGYGYGGYGYGGYGYGGYGYPYSYPNRPVSGRTPVIVGRPRGYTVRPLSSLPGANNRANGSGRGFGDGVVTPRGPSSGRGFGDGVVTPRGPSSGRGPVGQPSAAPPARRARPDGVQYPGGRDGGAARDGGNRGGQQRGGNDSPPARRDPPTRNDPPAARPSNPQGGSTGGRAPAPAPSAPRPSTHGRPRP